MKVHQLAEQLELPEGWAMQFTQAKESYFVDHVNKSTTWIDPRIGFIFYLNLFLVDQPGGLTRRLIV